MPALIRFSDFIILRLLNTMIRTLRECMALACKSLQIYLLNFPFNLHIDLYIDTSCFTGNNCSNPDEEIVNFSICCISAGTDWKPSGRMDAPSSASAAPTVTVVAMSEGLAASQEVPDLETTYLSSYNEEFADPNAVGNAMMLSISRIKEK
ncbi:hypothetical protein VTN77DRAFT_7625 [Rasamsonia byssochlamydoides]|uniref:uncharacterized protein n=1 Tax=Rasamsonia byssochlamydoides TaxID=89139 RepID=UPI003744AF61